MTNFDFPNKSELKNGSEIHVAIYVPSTKNFTEPISELEFKARINEVVSFLNSSFGGTTKIRGVGSYNLDGKPVEEKVAIVDSYTKSKDYGKVDLKLKQFLKKKRKEWSQDSMGYEFEEELIFVK